MQLSSSLVAVFSQTLCKRLDPAPGQFGRVMAQEIMINNPAIANLIREGKTAQLYSQIQTGGQMGMQTLEKALADLVFKGEISSKEAMAKASKPEELGRLLQGQGVKPSAAELKPKAFAIPPPISLRISPRIPLLLPPSTRCPPSPLPTQPGVASSGN